MLNVENVSKKYGKLLANDNLSFKVENGQIAILMGPNGAGKSTIIKSIAGLLRFDGKIEIDGFENKRIDAKKCLGYVPEMPAIYDLLTVEEHLQFICRAYGMEDEQYCKALLERFELWDKKDKLGKELSKGMQQKLSIACVLAHKPKTIVLDEPIVGLDPHAIKELKLMFRELKQQGCAILISTHMIDSVEDYWDVVHIMMKGRIAATRLQIDEEKQQESLEDLYFNITEGSSHEN